MALNYPDHLRYLDSHEYIAIEGDIATIGVSAFAIEELGDIVFLELPDEGASLERGESFGSIESVKAVADLFAPVSGTVVERNEEAIESPEILSSDPYGSGWLLKVQLDDLDSALEDTLSADEYRERVEGD